MPTPAPRLPALAAALSLLALAPAGPAHAQMGGMNCFANAGGRATCSLSTNALVDRLDRDASERRDAVAARQRQLIRAVAKAIHEGRCDDAKTLALRSDDPLLAASTVRLCPPTGYGPDGEPVKG